MTHKRMPLAFAVIGSAFLQGCTVSNIDFSTLERPPRAPELENYDIFVGTWDWTAEMHNADAANKDWTGTAEWRWTLDKRCLHGTMSAKNANTAFEAAGVWSWNPYKKQYVWWMFNNWGYPQQGTATYNECCKGEECKCWSMKYKSIGLDGTPSYGTYCMKVVDNDTLKWCNQEYADSLRTVKKVDMCGTYKRRK